MALNKKATYCEMNMQLSKELLDGDKNISYVVNTLCMSKSYIDVFLGKDYLIHYAVLYEGYSHLESWILFYCLMFYIICYFIVLVLHCIKIVITYYIGQC